MRTFREFLLKEEIGFPKHPKMTIHDDPNEIIFNVKSIFSRSIDKSIEQNVNPDHSWKTKHNPVYDPKVTQFKEYILKWAREFFSNHQELDKIIQVIEKQLNQEQESKAKLIAKRKLSGGVNDNDMSRLGGLTPEEYAATGGDINKVRAAVQKKYQMNTRPHQEPTPQPEQKQRGFFDKFKNYIDNGDWK